MRKRSIALLMTGVMLLSMAGCASNPDSAVVKEKNLDKMLEQAENTEEGATSIDDVAKEVEENYETYQTQIKDEALGVSVYVDAKVEIPEVEQLSVYRASQKEIEQDFLDKVREVLTPGCQYYEGKVLRVSTKADIAKDIQATKDIMNNLKVGDPDIPDEAALEQWKAEYQEDITRLEADYENAPDSISITDYPSDNQLHMVKDYLGDDFYEWQYNLCPSAEVYWGVNDGTDGEYISLYVQNNEDYGNCLRYESTKNGYVFTTSVDVENGRNDNRFAVNNVLKVEGEEPDFSGYDAQVKAFGNEPATLSEEEAREQADALLEQLGLTDYRCHDGGLYSEFPITESFAEEEGYRDIYSFLYMRSIDGVFVNNAAGYKLVDEWRGEDYVKKLWGNEAIVVGVNDSGVVLFKYLTPISIDETVVEKTSIKSFSEIKDTFEEMVVIENASEEETATVSIKVTDVRLVYTRISEKDSFDTGLIVPVWDFEGTVVNEYGDEKTGNILSINAIDGSVINTTLGY